MKKIAAVAAVTVVLANPVAASAHVSAEPSEAAAGTFSTISFGIPHGCDGSATTALTFAIPDGVEKVKPNVNPAWDITLDQQNDRVTSVTYKAKTPLPDTLRDSVALTVKPAESAAGQALLSRSPRRVSRGRSCGMRRTIRKSTRRRQFRLRQSRAMSTRTAVIRMRATKVTKLQPQQSPQRQNLRHSPAGEWDLARWAFCLVWRRSLLLCDVAKRMFHVKH
ncbi:YcnI family protein [Corynebacterium renale]|uniref:YcnI family protein n=1 Tax=Corynebacterium renale TaxID=1724 RepID=UPI00069ECF9D|nr:YcnI family protein [Corynebacterium renale]